MISCVTWHSNFISHIRCCAILLISWVCPNGEVFLHTCRLDQDHKRHCDWVLIWIILRSMLIVKFPFWLPQDRYCWEADTTKSGKRGKQLPGGPTEYSFSLSLFHPLAPFPCTLISKSAFLSTLSILVDSYYLLPGSQSLCL